MWIITRNEDLKISASFKNISGHFTPSPGVFAPELRGVVLQTAPHEDDGVAHAARVAVVEDTDPHPRDSVAAGKSLEHREQILQ